MNDLSHTYQTPSASTAVGEVPFGSQEMFFTRTDKRGVILEGNSVFTRVSGYTWDELKNAPHKIIRHQDMPKGVFQLFWDRIKNGQSMVAYVKNTSKEGRYYWVMALTWPVEEGYLSIRIKPGAETLSMMKDMYAKLLAAEKEESLTPEQSKDRLLEMLQEAGYKNYDTFMNTVIGLESAHRSATLGQQQDHVQRRFSEMFDVVKKLGEETEEMTEVIRAIRTVPMNMRILASRLENAGGPISAISVNYGSMLDEMVTWVHEFVEGENSTFNRIHDTILRGQFLVCAARIQTDMVAHFETDLEACKDDEMLETLREDSARLAAEAAEFREMVVQSLKAVEADVNRLSRSVLDMKRYVTGLSSTRMMCKIESAALYGSGDSSLSGIVDQLDAGQNEIEERLAKVVQLNSVIQGHTSMMRSID